MKWILLLPLIFFACTTQPSRINEQLSVQEIAPKTYVVVDQHYFYSNVLVAQMEDGTVIIASSPFETEGSKALLDWIKDKFSPPKVIAINTHYHSDGTGGNEAFKRAGVEIWASDKTRSLHKERGQDMRLEVALSFTDPQLRQRILNRNEVLADNVFPLSKGLKFSFGGEEVQVLYPGPAHSPDNVVINLPKRKVLFGGCMVRSANSTSLGYVGVADLNHWEKSIRSLLDLSAHIVIPGHGEVGGPELLEKTIQLASKARLNLKTP